MSAIELFVFPMWDSCAKWIELHGLQNLLCIGFVLAIFLTAVLLYIDCPFIYTIDKPVVHHTINKWKGACKCGFLFYMITMGILVIAQWF